MKWKKWSKWVIQSLVNVRVPAYSKNYSIGRSGRKNRLRNVRYDPSTIQDRVNQLLK